MGKNSLKEIAELIEKYDFEWSWYSDYPPTGFWKNDFSEKDYKEALNSLILKKNHPISLYFHFPFCPKRCFFCVCPSEITKETKNVDNFLKYQFKEIDLLMDFFDKRAFKPNIKLVHLGGGSPSFMNKEQITNLVQKMSLLVDINKLEEFSIEIDPRTVDKEKLVHYSELGINRISLGIQDFDDRVQKAVNRVQPKELIEELFSSEIRSCFKSINFDLIYGMPLQTRESFKNTVEEVIKFSPDRISTGFMFYKPELLAHQRIMRPSEIPNFHEKTMMFLEAIQRFTEEGYVMIGIGHFTKPKDNLAIALKNRTMGRSQMGYTPGVSEDFIGFGPWAMGRILNYYYQNNHSVSDYCEVLNNGRFPVFRGYILSKDEMIRREVIREIICFSSVDYNKIEKKYGINFMDYFKEELKSLDFFVKEGMVEKSSDGFDLTYIGRFFQRHVCTCFDKLFKEKKKYRHSLHVSNRC